MPTLSRVSTRCAAAIDAVVDRAGRMPDWQLGLAVFVPVLVVYVLTGTTAIAQQSPDGVAAALPAWHWAAYHSFYLDHVKTQNLWVAKFNHHWVSNRQPGIVVFGIPFYLLLDRSSHFSMFPAVVAAGTAAAGTVALMTLTVRRALSPRLALLTGVILAFGTATWSVSADTLWPHGPDQLFLTAALYLLARNKLLPASVAIACCVPIRAHLAVVAAIAGIYFTVKHRSVKPFAVFALPSLIGLELLSVYNHWIFGTWSISGGYMPYATDNLESIGHGSSILSFCTDVIGSFVSFDRGIVIWCPLAIVLLVGVRAGWRESPDWVHVAALGGLAYYAIQMKISYFTGGDRFWSYRVILESLTLLTPLLAFAARDVLRRRPVAARLAAAAAVYGIGTQAVGAIYYSPNIYHYSPWWHSKLADELVSGGLGPRVIMALTVVAVVAALAWRRPAAADIPAAGSVPATEAPLALASQP